MEGSSVCKAGTPAPAQIARGTIKAAAPHVRGCSGMQVDESYAEVRVVGGENMADERPLTEGLELFDTGVEVSL